MKRRAVFWCDMEGIAGILKWDQVMAGAAQYEEGRKLYTDEINACVRGAKRAGYKEIIVVDGHGAGGEFSFNSLLKDKLESGAEYVFGYRWGCYIDPLKDGNAVMLLPGAHAMAGTFDGVLCHTMSSQSWYNAYINGRAVGESGIVAAIASSFNIPCAFVSGDEATCKEVQSFVGKKIYTAVVKKSLDRFSCRTLAPQDACSLVEKKVYDALSHPDNWPEPLKLKSPVEFKVELSSPDKAKDFIGKEGVTIVDARTIEAKGPNFWHVWNNFWYH
jgi:D-amino peptidase